MYNLLRIDGRATNIALHESIVLPSGTRATACIDIEVVKDDGVSVDLGSFQNLQQLLGLILPEGDAYAYVNAYGRAHYNGTYWLVGTRQAGLRTHTTTANAFCIAIKYREDFHYVSTESVVKNLPAGAERAAEGSEFSLRIEHLELSKDINSALLFNSIDDARATLELSNDAFPQGANIQVHTFERMITSQPACVLPFIPVCVPGTEKDLKYMNHAMNMCVWDADPEIAIALEDNFAEPVGWTFMKNVEGISPQRPTRQLVSGEHTLDKIEFKKNYGEIDMIETLVMLKDCRAGDTATVRHYGTAIYFGNAWFIGLDDME